MNIIKNLPNYNDVVNEIEIKINLENYGYNMNNKDLINYIDELILVNRENDDEYDYTEKNNSTR